MRKFIKIALITLGVGIFSYIISIVIGLWMFAPLSEKKLIVGLKYNDSYYELYGVFQGALGQDCVQSVIDGEVYANDTIKRRLDDVTIESIMIKDSISFILKIEEECFPIHVPLVLKSAPSDSTARIRRIAMDDEVLL